MSQVFLDYSKYYDVLYKDKNYHAEVDFIVSLIRKHNPNAKTILNLGCGTGAHDIFLAEAGYDVVGVDLSQEMLNVARNKNPNCSYHLGDARNVNLNKKFDVVISLFHVLSYQTSNQDVLDFMKTISIHMNNEGCAIFDYWYGPTVLSVKPEKRTKNFESEELKVVRNAFTDVDYVKNVATVNYDINITDKKNGNVINLQEKHPMRYFFSPELEYINALTGFKTRAHHAWESLNAAPSENIWAAYSVLSK